MKTNGKRMMMIWLSAMLVMSSAGMAYADESLKVETAADVADNAFMSEAFPSGTKIAYNSLWITDGAMSVDGVTYLPLVEIVNLLGLQTGYDENTHTITITSDWNPENHRGTADLVYGNGTCYKGGYKNGRFEGDGTIVFSDGSTYAGHFINGAMAGEGKYTAANGDSYEGQFADNDYKGYGKYTYANGDTIEATFNGGTFTGYACVDIHGEDEENQIKAYEWKLPIETVGMAPKAFDLSKFNGSVDLVYADGSRYEGGMKDNSRNGSGTLTGQDGTEYKGNWVMGNKSGYGTMSYEDGSVYRGYFIEGVRSGYGKLLYVNGDIYDGAWEDGRREGYGKFIESNGNYFYGIWKKDVKHTAGEEDDEDYEGYGTYVVNKKNTSDGETDKYKQKWIEGRLIRERKDN